MLFKSLYTNQVRIKDCLLSIANRCQECSISNFCENQTDFEVLIGALSAGALGLISDSFVKTPFTKKIMSSHWHSDMSMITFRKNSSVITVQEAEKRIEQSLKDEGIKESSWT